MSIRTAFGLLGLLVGNLIGLTAQSVVTAVVPILFAFGGGSVLALMKDLTPELRREAAQAIAALSVMCLLGVYSGILVCEYQLLSPSAARYGVGQQKETTQSSADRGSDVGSRKYLRNSLVPIVDALDQQIENYGLSYSDAYHRLAAEVRRTSKDE